MSDSFPSLLLAGCGKMGSALLHGWHKKGLRFTDLTVVEPGDVSSIPPTATWVRSLTEADPSYPPLIIVLAVKPQVMAPALAEYAARFPDALYVTIAAGKTLSFYTSLLGEKSQVVRVMPNTPALVSKGMSVAVANANVTALQKDSVTELFQAVGDVAWLEDESLMDAVTAISGSGPAYVFYFMEAFINAATEAGIPQELATQLVRKTVHGSLHLAEQNTESLDVLRRNVTSPGGTTEAALNALMGDQALQKILSTAVKNAVRRSRELSEN